MKFNIDHPIFEFINKVFHFMALNLIFLLSCLPLFTIGASLTSMYGVMLREARGEYSYLIRTYLKNFIQNFKTATLTFLLLLATGMILLFNMTFWTALESVLGTIISLLIAFVLCMLLLTCLYIFPMLARFENPIVQTLKNAFFLAITNKKSTLFLLLIDAFVVLCCFFIPQMKLFMVLLGFAFISYCQSFILKKVFEPYEMAQSKPCTLSA